MASEPLVGLTVRPLDVVLTHSSDSTANVSVCFSVQPHGDLAAHILPDFSFVYRNKPDEVQKCFQLSRG